MKGRILLSTILLLLLQSTAAFAWDAFGHMEVAQIAWDRLTPSVRARVSELLRLNPQYVAWATNVPAHKQDQVAFLRASTWPDFIRGARGYISDGSEGGNRPPPGPEAAQNIGYSDLFMHKYWHFVDLPFSPDGTTLEDPPSPNAGTQIALFRKALSSELTTNDVKSYDLSWLIHLVGDVHQPLHATSRFTTGKPHGDAGGNSVTIDCGGCEAITGFGTTRQALAIAQTTPRRPPGCCLQPTRDRQPSGMKTSGSWRALNSPRPLSTRRPLGPGPEATAWTLPTNRGHLNSRNNEYH
ncbi:S1/P1 nuclease [Bradyrhizobium sp. CIAT3101]|uniref:S1/P1 nuclease n=1 Tax=Bradyrhizobium sp. CIAT3101 TaxID=439387 RepID=UPI0024B1FAED|nr:S1/P1 nuclease [Bradyrhizobium sp. CIAT3101]WFU80755.1 S1/P1 nuclease [Bradyrhizobium sp. CIAT3101]